MSDTSFKKPGTRVIFIGIITVAVVASAIIVQFKPRPAQKIAQDMPATASVHEPTPVPETDSDGDGVPDWEEALWKLDPNNPDTNNDGVGDLVEVQNKKEADRLAREEMLTEGTQSSFSFYSNQNLTKTEAISRALFEQAVTASNMGLPLTPENANEIATILGDTLLTKPVVTKERATSADIRTISNPTVEQIRAYGNLVAGTMKVEVSEQNNEFLALVEFMQTGNPGALTKLGPVIQHYTTVADNLLAVSAPTDVAQSHLSLINGLYTNAEILTQLQNLANDSMSIIPYLQTYQANYNGIASSLSQIKAYLNSRGIVYNEFEDGFLLVTMY